jgi:hypothetical protein
MSTPGMCPLPPGHPDAQCPPMMQHSPSVGPSPVGTPSDTPSPRMLVPPGPLTSMGLPGPSQTVATSATGVPLSPRIPGSTQPLRLPPSARQEYEVYMQNRLRMMSQGHRPTMVPGVSSLVYHSC